MKIVGIQRVGQTARILYMLRRKTNEESQRAFNNLVSGRQMLRDSQELVCFRDKTGLDRSDLHWTFAGGVSRTKDQSVKFWAWCGFRIRITIINFGGGFQSPTGCLVYNYIDLTADWRQWLADSRMWSLAKGSCQVKSGWVGQA